MREIFLSDIHWPFHGKAEYNTALKIIQYRQPDIVHIGGDGVDFHSISRHPKQMIDRTMLKYEVEESRNEIAKLRKAAPNAQINFQEGNHDARMQIYLRDRAPELSDLFELTFPNLMQFDKYGIEWIDENKKYAIGKLWHEHGHKLPGAGASPAKAKFMKTFQNIIFGHHHTFDYYSVNQYGSGELYQSLSNACLYKLDPEYAKVNHWHNGITEINYSKSGDFAANQIHIRSRGDGTVFGFSADGIEFNSTDDENIDKYLTAAAKRIPPAKSARKTAK